MNQTWLGSGLNFHFIVPDAIAYKRIAEIYNIHMYKVYNYMILYIQTYVTIPQSILEPTHHPLELLCTSELNCPFTALPLPTHSKLHYASCLYGLPILDISINRIINIWFS
jgi:hypothetical protein